jgi:hypothetical protein
MVVELESVQIQSLQKLIRVQDELMKKEVREVDDICSVWKNECYRLVTQKQIAEEESVRLGIQCLEIMEEQREQIGLALRHAIDSFTREHERSINQRLAVLDKRLHTIERALRKLPIPDRCPSTMPADIVQLQRRNRELEDQVRNLQFQLQDKFNENYRLQSELNCLNSDARKPTTPSKGIDVAINASPGTASEIKHLLAELKSLEAEAQQMLIKP